MVVDHSDLLLNASFNDIASSVAARFLTYITLVFSSADGANNNPLSVFVSVNELMVFGIVLGMQ